MIETETITCADAKGERLTTTWEERWHPLREQWVVSCRFDNLWQMPFPYVMPLHEAPTDGRDYRNFHFHIEFHPPLRRPNLLALRRARASKKSGRSKSPS